MKHRKTIRFLRNLGFPFAIRVRMAKLIDATHRGNLLASEAAEKAKAQGLPLKARSFDCYEHHPCGSELVIGKYSVFDLMWIAEAFDAWAAQEGNPKR
jgi:hypothetical protein